MNSNKFELIGKINYIDVKTAASGTVITKVLLGVYLGKDKEGKSLYDSMEVTMFGDVAKNFATTLFKGDSAYIDGRIAINKYTTKDGKEMKTLQLIGNDFLKVEYDKDARDFKSVSEAVQESIPWA